MFVFFSCLFPASLPTPPHHHRILTNQCQKIYIYIQQNSPLSRHTHRPHIHPGLLVQQHHLRAVRSQRRATHNTAPPLSREEHPPKKKQTPKKPNPSPPPFWGGLISPSLRAFTRPTPQLGERRAKCDNILRFSAPTLPPPLPNTTRRLVSKAQRCSARGNCAKHMACPLPPFPPTVTPTNNQPTKQTNKQTNKQTANNNQKRSKRSKYTQFPTCSNSRGTRLEAQQKKNRLASNLRRASYILEVSLGLSFPPHTPPTQRHTARPSKSTYLHSNTLFRL